MSIRQIAGRCVVLVGLAVCNVSAAVAQRAAENAVVQSLDAFGTSLNTERTGLYSEADIRGFSPIAAGNTRIEELYFDRQATVNFRIIRNSRVRVGITAQSYPFTAPTGVVEYNLRQLGDKRAIAAYVAAGPFSGKVLEVDSQLPIDRNLSVGVGIALRRQEDIENSVADYRALGLLAKWTPTESIRVRPFWGRTWNDIPAAPVIIPRGPGLPPEISRKFKGQPWAETHGYGEALGVVVDNGDKQQPWRLRLGLFQSNLHNDRSYTDISRNVGTDGIGDRLILAQPVGDTESTSGEVRATREWHSERWRHLVHATARARDVTNDLDAPTAISLGRVSIDDQAQMPKPTIVPRNSRTHQKIEQEAVGIAYETHWASRGEATVGIQSVEYEKTVSFPSGQGASSSDTPLLVSATAAAYVSSAVALYAGYTEGLEESGTAPENASNFQEILPAQRTQQQDAGLRWRITPQLSAIVGVFELEKPYFGFDAARRFVEVGKIENRGVELSLTGKAHSDVTVVLGAALSRPRVEVDGSQGGNSLRPVAVPSETARLSLDYRPHQGSVSFDTSATFIGSRYADGANLIEVPSYTIIDAGIRKRFQIGRSQATARLLMANCTDEFGWRVNIGGGLQPLEGRRISASLSADF